MQVKLEDGTVLLVAETEAERRELAAWAEVRADRLFRLTPARGTAVRLTDLGSHARLDEPALNITWDAAPKPFDLIANLAPTPFELDGRHYASVEGFWQGLKLPEGPERERVAALAGHDARKAGGRVRYGDTVTYQGRPARVGTVEHWELMEMACWAKFEHHKAARAALLATAPRRLEHKVKVDSKTIPGVIMADIWMRQRARLLAGG
jgi:predicted NAD-dependent protein-ADP-ribosyltransferase YbiA (DUF1768 family)